VPHTTRPPRRIIKWHFIEFSERPPPLGGLSIYNLRGQTKKARLRRKYLADFVALHESLPGPFRQILQRKQMSAFRVIAEVAAGRFKQRSWSQS
jgi:hypothetical protein